MSYTFSMYLNAEVDECNVLIVFTKYRKKKLGFSHLFGNSIGNLYVAWRSINRIMKCGFVLLMTNISWELPLRNTQLKNFLKRDCVQSVILWNRDFSRSSLQSGFGPSATFFISISDVNDFWRLPTLEKGYPAWKGSSAWTGNPACMGTVNIQSNCCTKYNTYFLICCEEKARDDNDTKRK